VGAVGRHDHRELLTERITKVISWYSSEDGRNFLLICTSIWTSCLLAASLAALVTSLQMGCDDLLDITGKNRTPN